MKLKGILMLAAILMPIAGSTLTTFAAEQPAIDNSNVTANVNSGGLHLKVKDHDFGNLTIGTPIPENHVDGLTEVTDHTGSNGWDLALKSTNYDVTKDNILLGVQADGGEKVNITGESAPYLSGESQLDPISTGGTFTGEWGTTPKQGGYENNLMWTLTPKLHEANTPLMNFEEIMDNTNEENGNLEYGTESLVVNYDEQGMSNTRYRTELSRYSVRKDSNTHYFIEMTLNAFEDGPLSRGLETGDEAFDTRATFNMTLAIPNPLTGKIEMDKTVKTDGMTSNGAFNGIDIYPDRLESQDAHIKDGKAAQFTPQYTLTLVDGSEVVIDALVSINYM